ncbi:MULTISPECIES: Dam family site-specific DNA-(adenine-N6)-methyltransferase [Alteromonas]|jgi:DNA adenine methylase|uniref:Site-specific DNA-methyltransferase (adenine-specific) n=4 Tax=Alteromonas mediterranea TaxID=314275 RepID=S5AAU3_9ALTE|nr:MULTISPECIES: Dam family site-specific DNA-(adenine-N6)-methyltransferase [Alteromonas]AGP76770.1 DNA adenine methylase [Alteromonas mediterranea 615]AGP92243.1 DNA adenine methylase [Alteromonas mediterranea U8]MBR9785961.1 Dam family site-specific DNA-(adenine-N6)-methyltransferase [Gammaproteobacteria bacterium]MDY6884600.1 Dam family site-specific DNA-(adenine-N6)-methyltransferase [Pseudomonadota bacterium]AEA96659.1 DNA adenine methylase [Alteromonas mediterranea DE]|tara:strand:+ start:165 stop:1046 length:882 start_codon:yes stop_codon:yes gene_type:complete
MMQKKNRAFLKWAGGKYSLVEHIQARLPQANKLIEPFVGAGSVFLNTQYKRYLLNDINPDLINLYNFLKAQPDALINDARSFFDGKRNEEKMYYALREEFNATEDEYYRAILFLYLNRHGYNGLCRYSLQGRFNVPFGRYKKPYFPEDEMFVFSEKSQKATFTCLPFEKVFSRARRGNVIYCDPPYAPISKTAAFTSYAARSFGQESQEKLAELATRASKKRGIPVLISNHDLPLTRALYQGADFSMLSVKRSISQNGAKRQPVDEILAYFPPAKVVAKRKARKKKAVQRPSD